VLSKATNSSFQVRIVIHYIGTTELSLHCGLCKPTSAGPYNFSSMTTGIICK